MSNPPPFPAQMGFPEALPDLLGVAAGLVLLMILVAITGFVYRHLTGGVEWPEDDPEGEDGLRQGGDDDEWDYY